MMLHTMEITTSKRDEMRDITREVQAYVKNSGVLNGLLIVYCPHTTAGIAINENADPDVKRDVLMRLDEVYPWEHPKYRHAEGNTASHLKSITAGPSQTLIIHEGAVLLAAGRASIFASSMVQGNASATSKLWKASTACPCRRAATHEPRSCSLYNL